MLKCQARKVQALRQRAVGRTADSPSQQTEEIFEKRVWQLDSKWQDQAMI
jgi:hypothetical protein